MVCWGSCSASILSLGIYKQVLLGIEGLLNLLRRLTIQHLECDSGDISANAITGDCLRTLVLWHFVGLIAACGETSRQSLQGKPSSSLCGEELY